MPLPFWHNLPTMAGYILIVGLTCVTTAVTAAILLDDLSENGDELDFNLPDHRRDVHGARWR